MSHGTHTLIFNALAEPEPEKDGLSHATLSPDTLATSTENMQPQLQE